MSYPPLEITFLGTGTSSGVPMVGCSCEVCASQDSRDKRLRSSILVQSPTTSFVVDSGPDFRQQMLTHSVKNLDAILLTHSHKDHIAGLDDVRGYNYFQQRPMDVFGTEATLSRIKIEFDYAFAEVKYAGVPAIHLHHLDYEHSFVVGDMEIQPIPVWHMYMPVMGFRLGDFTYITDANRIEEAAKEKIKGSKVLVLNALRKEPHISHFNLEEALRLADELGVPEVYLLHLSHQMGLHSIISEELPQGRFLAYDGLKIQIP